MIALVPLRVSAIIHPSASGEQLGLVISGDSHYRHHQQYLPLPPLRSTPPKNLSHTHTQFVVLQVRLQSQKCGLIGRQCELQELQGILSPKKGLWYSPLHYR